MLNIQWEEPRPLRQTADTIPFPLEALPPVLRNMAQTISVTTSTDIGMSGTAMLSAVGYCFSGIYRLASKAKKIVQMLKTKEIKQGLKSELYHSCRCNLFSKAIDFYNAIDTLAEYGYVAYEDITAANNKKTQLIYVNPHI